MRVFRFLIEIIFILLPFIFVFVSGYFIYLWRGTFDSFPEFSLIILFYIILFSIYVRFFKIRRNEKMKFESTLSDFFINKKVIFKIFEDFREVMEDIEAHIPGNKSRRKNELMQSGFDEFQMKMDAALSFSDKSENNKYRLRELIDAVNVFEHRYVAH